MQHIAGKFKRKDVLLTLTCHGLLTEISTSVLAPSHQDLFLCVACMYVCALRACLVPLESKCVFNDLELLTVVNYLVLCMTSRYP